MNKCDALDKKTISERRRALEKASGGPVHVISGVAGMGLHDVLRDIFARIKAGSEVVVEAAPWQP